MTDVEDTNPLRSSAMNMAEPPTSGWTIVLPFLEDGLEPQSEQTTLPLSSYLSLAIFLHFNHLRNYDSSRSL